MLYTVVALLFFYWLVGVSEHLGGSFIHLLLGLAIAICLFDLLHGKPRAV